MITWVTSCSTNWFVSKQCYFDRWTGSEMQWSCVDLTWRRLSQLC